MSLLKPSGVMHCWLAAKAEVAGEVYVCLRGVNFDHERTYDRDHPGVEHLKPFWHVPSTKVTYATPDQISAVTEPREWMKLIPDTEATLTRVHQGIEVEWPALAQAQVVAADCELTGAWGGCPIVNKETGERRFDAVTRVFLDFGAVDVLPTVKFKPEATLPWCRHPVEWIKARRIVDYVQKGNPVQQGNQLSSVVVDGEHAFVMERPEGLIRAYATDIVLQQTVADIFSRNGVRFVGSMEIPRLRPSLIYGAAVVGS